MISLLQIVLAFVVHLACLVGLIFAIPLSNLLQVVTYVALIGPQKAARPYAVYQLGRRSLSRRPHFFPASFRRNATTSGSCQSAAPISVASMRPARSIRNVAGMPSVRNTGGILPFFARRNVMLKFLSFKNWRTVSELSSIETQRNLMSLLAIRPSRASLSIDGISLTQGGHHVAQKFKKIGLPLN